MTLPSYAGRYARLIDVTDAARAHANSFPSSTTHRVNHGSVPVGTCYCEKLVSRWGLDHFTVCAKQQSEFWAKTCASFTRHPALLMSSCVCLEITGLGNVDPNGELQWAAHMVSINERGGDQTTALTQNTWILANTNTRSHSQRFFTRQQIYALWGGMFLFKLYLHTLMFQYLKGGRKLGTHAFE